MYPQNLLKRQVVAEKKKQSFVFITVVFLLTLYLLGLILIDEDSIARYMGLKEKRAEINAEISTLRKENMALAKNIEELKEESFFIEKLAREELNLSRPDEYIFIFDR